MTLNLKKLNTQGGFNEMNSLENVWWKTGRNFCSYDHVLSVKVLRKS